MKKLIPAVLSISLLATGCSSEPTETQEQTVSKEKFIPVNVVPVNKEEIKNTLEYSGVVSPSKTVNVISTVTAEVTDTYFEVGDTVNEGELLFKVDTSNINDQIRQLNSQLKTANVGVAMANNQANSVSGGAFQSQVDQLESTIKSTKKQVDLAYDSYTVQKESYEKGKVLFENGIISKSDFDAMELGYTQAKTSYDSAVLQLEQLENSYELTTNDILNENTATGQLGVAQAQASKESLQVQLDITNKMLNDASVTAPISGIVASKGVNVNEFVSSQIPAYTIIDMNSVLINVQVSEKIINTINKGDEVDVLINAVSNTPFKGTVKSVSPVAGQTSTYPVEIEIANPDHSIKPGMFTTAIFDLNSRNDVIVIPAGVTLSDLEETYVFIEDNGTAKKVVIETGINNGEYVEVLSGLKVNDNLIVTGQSYLKDGDDIKVVE